MVSFEQATFLTVAIATHGVVGYTLGKGLFDRPIVGLFAGMAADIDFLFPNALGWPFVHRGITHTLLVGGLLVGIVAYRNRQTAAAIAVTYGSHLLIDTTTPKGVPHLYPVVETNYYLDLGTTGHSPVPTLAIWACCLTALWLLGDERIDAPRL